MTPAYDNWREAHHAALNARTVVIGAGLAKASEYQPLKVPEPPIS